MGMQLWSVYPLLGGLVGVMVMNLVLREERLLHLPALHFISRVGVIFHRDGNQSRVPMTVVHYLVGILVAYLYTALFLVVPTVAGHPALVVFTCALLGAVHGVFSMVLMTVALDDDAPIMRDGAFQPAELLSFMLAYAAFGATIGLMVAYVPGLL